MVAWKQRVGGVGCQATKFEIPRAKTAHHAKRGLINSDPRHLCARGVRVARQRVFAPTTNLISVCVGLGTPSSLFVIRLTR